VIQERPKSKRTVLMITSVLMVIASVLVVATWSHIAAAFGSMVNVKAVSMTEAYNIAKPRALDWNPKAKLYHMISVDPVENKDNQAGLDGKRPMWNLDFVIPGTERHLTVYVTDRAVERVIEGRNPNIWSGYDQLPAIPMAKVLKMAKEKGLKPGKDVLGQGLHFRLLYYSEARRVEFWVYGQTTDGKKLVLRFDPETGDLLTGAK
jgi:hypothetical protein